MRHAVAREAREMGEELVARRRDGAKGRDDKEAEAEVGREGRRVDTVLVTTRRPYGVNTYLYNTTHTQKDTYSV